MKKIVTIVAVVMGLIMTGNSVKAQGGTKIGVISLQELIPTMSDYKRPIRPSMISRRHSVSSSMTCGKNTTKKTAFSNPKDTVKFTKAQLEMKRRK